MSVSVKIIADSIGPANVRLITFELTYPHYIHAEVMSYKLASRNAASSRAIPVKKRLQNTRHNKVVPTYWGENRSGMTAGTEVSYIKRKVARMVWMFGFWTAYFTSWTLGKLNVHKQLSNRPLEPYYHITTIFTMDQFGLANLFSQRCHPDAQPEFQDLARAMYRAMENSNPNKLMAGEWHIPFIRESDIKDVEGLCTKNPDENKLNLLLKIATGRVARSSYLNHNGIRDITADIGLHDRLLMSDPPHQSPFEHSAMALEEPVQIANFCGWKQYRKFFAHEFTREFKMSQS